MGQSADGGWTGWTMEGSPTTLDSWQPWEAAVDASEAPHVRWFCGGQTNAAFNEVDRQVLRGYGGEMAFIAESPSGETSNITRRWLLLHSAIIAHARCATGCASPRRSVSRCTAGVSEGGREASLHRRAHRHGQSRSQPPTRLAVQVHAQHATRGGVDRVG